MTKLLLIIGVVSASALLAGCGGGGEVAAVAIDPALPPVDPKGPPVAIRPENLCVQPSTGPLTHVLVQNLLDKPYTGTIHVTVPPGWKLDATSKPVTIAPRQLARIPFAIEKAIDAESNVYAIGVRVSGGGQDVVWDTPVVGATTPYYKPVIDGKGDDWGDAVPITFTVGGKKTVVRSYWSRKAFSLRISVEETAHVAMGNKPFDAVQVAISPARARTPRQANGTTQRYEILLASGAGGGKCFMLTRPGEAASAGQTPQTLAGRELAGAKLVVSRAAGMTHYECALPLAAMPAIRAEPGREFRMSLLVHDPDGTGLRDWGGTVGLWPWQRNRLAWSVWPGAAWPAEAPFDNKIEWAFSSSIH